MNLCRCGVRGALRALTRSAQEVLLIVLDNLVENAVEVSPTGGTVTVAARAAQPWAELRVQDEGPGLGPDETERAFDRFWRRRSAREAGSASRSCDGWSRSTVAPSSCWQPPPRAQGSRAAAAGLMRSPPLHLKKWLRNRDGCEIRSYHSSLEGLAPRCGGVDGMSHAKRQRKKQRPAAERQAPPVQERDSRLAPVRRRTRLAKFGVGLAVSAVFGGSIALARATYAGHAKHPSRPLAVPKSFYSVIRENLLQNGILAPAQAPPDAQTSSS